MSDQLAMLFSFINYRNGYYMGCDYNLGVSYIQTYLETKGYHTEQFYSKGPVTVNEMVDQMLETGTRIFGFTMYDVNFFIIRIITRELKSKAPDCKIIIGGPTATFEKDTVFKYIPDVDILAIGESEVTVYELLEHLTHNKDLDNVTGISYRRGKEIIDNQERELIKDLDSFPSPIVERKMPYDHIFDINGSGIITSRGCYGKCVYCSFAKMSKGKIRFHSVKRVVDELTAIEDACAAGEFLSNNQFSAFDKFIAGKRNRKFNSMHRIIIDDDAFTMNKNRIREILQAIIAKQFEHIYFSCHTRIDAVDDKILTLLRDANFVSIGFGLESADPRILNTIKKVRATDGAVDDYKKEKEFLEKFQYYTRKAIELDLEPNIYVISGLPGENMQSAKETLTFVKALGADNYKHNILSIRPGSELSAAPEKYGLKIEPGERILPYRTIHSYDVGAVPRLNLNIHHAALSMEKNYETNFILTAFCGHKNSRSINNLYPYITYVVAGDNHTVFDQKLNDWLSKMTSLNSITLIESAKEKYAEIKTEYIRSNPPNSMIRNIDYRNDALLYTSMSPIINPTMDNDKITHKFNMIEFKNFDPKKASDDIAQEDPETSICNLYRIKDQEDIDRINAITNKILENRSIKILGAHISTNPAFVDECMWRGTCTKTLGSRMFVEKDNIKLCFYVEPMGKVGYDTKDFMKKILQNRFKQMANLKCAECQADTYCPKCVLLSNHLQGIYCKFIKSNRYYWLIPLTFRGIRSIWMRRAEELDRENPLTVLFSPPKAIENSSNINLVIPNLRMRLITLKSGQNFYIYNESVDQLSKVTPDIFKIYTILRNGGSVEIIIEAIMKKFATNTQTALSLLKKVLNIFHKFNYFKQSKAQEVFE